MHSKPKFNADKCKVNLKMLVTRFQLLTQKKANLAKQQKRQVALLLREEKEANARILVEHIIREDYTLESYELLKQYTEQLIARFNVLVTEAELRPEIAEAVCALLYGGWLMGSDVPELKELHKLFTAKFGVPYAQEVIDNKEKYINHRLLRMLTSTQVPDPTVIELYLGEIAKAYNVDWTPKPIPVATQPISSTIGVPLPLPGMPVPGSGVDEQPQATLTAASTWAVPVDAAEASPYSSAAGATIDFDNLPTATAVPACSSSASSAPSSAISAVPAAAASSSTPTPVVYTVSLLKNPAGFGLQLDSENAVLNLLPNTEADRCGRIKVGDRVLSLNGIEVNQNRPVKSVAIDLSEGDIATFHMLRMKPDHTDHPTPSPPQPAPSPPSVTATPLPPSESYGASVVATPLPPSEPTSGSATATQLPPCGPVNGSISPALYPSTASAPHAADEDDDLLSRLENLKRS